MISFSWEQLLLISWLVVSIYGGIFSKIEGYFLPVVKNFQITSYIPLDDYRTLIYGKFDKIRNCAFESTAFYLKQGDLYSKVDIVFEDHDRVRKIGPQEFGPWKIRTTIDELREAKIIAIHSCHPMFNTITSQTVVTNIIK